MLRLLLIDMPEPEAKCAECHYEDDFSGEAAEAISAMIGDIKAGKTKHSEDLAGLSEEDIKKLAEYFASQ